jgi:hypothetical protein
MNAREKYKEKIRAYNETRPKLTITTKTGVEFIIRKLDAVEFVKVFAIMGVTMDEIESLPPQVLGKKLLSCLDELLRQIVVPLAVEPKLKSYNVLEVALDGPDVLYIEDLEAQDKADIIQTLVEASQGSEGKALGEAFRYDQPRENGRTDGSQAGQVPK